MTDATITRAEDLWTGRTVSWLVLREGRISGPYRWDRVYGFVAGPASFGRFLVRSEGRMDIRLWPGSINILSPLEILARTAE